MGTPCWPCIIGPALPWLSLHRRSGRYGKSLLAGEGLLPRHPLRKLSVGIGLGAGKLVLILPIVRRLSGERRDSVILPIRHVAAGDRRPRHGPVGAVAGPPAVALIGRAGALVRILRTHAGLFADESVRTGGGLSPRGQRA